MNRYKPVRLLAGAMHSLRQQKLRAALSVLGVVCGVMAVVAMVAVGQGARQQALQQIERLGTRNIYVKAIDLNPAQRARAREKRSPGLNPGDLERIERGCPQVVGISCLRDIRVALVGTPTEISPEVVACSANYSELLGIHVTSGRFIKAIDERQKNLVCVLGHTVAHRLGGRGDALNFIRMGNHLFKVVGMLQRTTPAGDDPSAVIQRNCNEMVFIPLTTAAALVEPDAATPGAKPSDPTGLSEIIVQVKPGADVVAAARLVDRILAVAHQGVRDYQLVVPLELLEQARQTQRTFNLVLGSIAGISLLVGGIGIMNIMLATVSERTREIGIRRAVGATRGDILMHFLTEAALLTVSGGLIGLLGGLGAVGLIAQLTGWPMALSLWGLLVPLGMSLLVGIFFGLYPARKAAGVDPIVALRHD
jgi:putative ABC transport system permease protein